MTLLVMVIVMISAMLMGKRSKELGLRQYFLLALLTLLQVGIVLYQVYTMQRPPAL